MPHTVMHKLVNPRTHKHTHTHTHARTRAPQGRCGAGAACITMRQGRGLPLARTVEEEAALPPHRLRDEEGTASRHLAGGPGTGKASGMELHKLHVADRGACAVGHGHSVSRDHARVGRVGVNLAGSTCGQHGDWGDEAHQLARLLIENVHAKAMRNSPDLCADTCRSQPLRVGNAEGPTLLTTARWPHLRRHEMVDRALASRSSKRISLQITC